MTPLVLLLLYERHLGTASRMHAYVNSLPRRFDTPLFWTDTEIEELQYPPISQRVRSIWLHDHGAGFTGPVATVEPGTAVPVFAMSSHPECRL